MADAAALTRAPATSELLPAKEVRSATTSEKCNGGPSFAEVDRQLIGARSEAAGPLPWHVRQPLTNQALSEATARGDIPRWMGELHQPHAPTDGEGASNMVGEAVNGGAEVLAVERMEVETCAEKESREAQEELELYVSEDARAATIPPAMYATLDVIV